MALTDISLLFKDIIETPQQKQQRLFAEGQAAAGQFTGLPTGLRELAMGTASGIPNMVESVRQFGATAGLPVQTQGEQLQGALSGIDTSNQAGRDAAVAAVRGFSPSRAMVLDAAFKEQVLKEDELQSRASANRQRRLAEIARQEEINRNKVGLEAYQELVENAAEGFDAYNNTDFSKLDKNTLDKIYQRVAPTDRWTDMMAYRDDGTPYTIWRDAQGRLYDTDRNPITDPPELLISASLTGRTLGDIGVPEDVQQELIQDQVDVQMLNRSIGQAIRLSEESPGGAALTWAGAASGVLNTLQAEVGALSGNVERWNPELNYDEDQGIQEAVNRTFDIDKLGVDYGQLKSMIISMAYLNSRAVQAANSISDRDIIRFIDELGGNQSDPRVFVANLQRIGRNAVARFEASYLANFKTPFEGDLGQNDLFTSRERLQREMEGR